MNHFNYKSLAFYGVAIGSVLLLFKTVTAYGENNLQASPVIDGSYRLTLAKNLPNCEKSDSLMLNIRQSGIYLNASLLPASTNADTEKHLSLTGILNKQQLNLSGQVDKAIICNMAPPHTVTTQMQLGDKGDLTGQISIRGIPQPLEFTATPEKPQTQPKKSNSH
jgi:hypothetical protein